MYKTADKPEQIALDPQNKTDQSDQVTSWLDGFDFELPEELISLRPAQPRESAGLLEVFPTPQTKFNLGTIADLPQRLRPSDILVVNNTKVIPAAMRALRPSRSEDSPATQISLMLLKPIPNSRRWLCLAQPSRRLRIGDQLMFMAPDSSKVPSSVGELSAKCVQYNDLGQWIIEFAQTSTPLDSAIAAYGQAPLPPYIAKRRAGDAADYEDYQTIFAHHSGSVAAPTAGLHLTAPLLEEISNLGVKILEVTLHINQGTFRPLTAANMLENRLHDETMELSSDVAAHLSEARRRGNRIVAVGTTSLRALESARQRANDLNEFAAFSGETGIFLKPGDTITAADALLTNFHLPRSSLYLLVAAFAGVETIQQAYAHAIAHRMRFYSYGDACLLHRLPA